MRHCGLWISPRVDPSRVVIIDTSTPEGAEEFRPHAGLDVMPTDMVLVVVHPARHRRFVEQVKRMTWPEPFRYYADVNGSAIAAEIIERRCRDNPGLKTHLHWE